jgi:hypothetical protein
MADDPYQYTLHWHDSICTYVTEIDLHDVDRRYLDMHSNGYGHTADVPVIAVSGKERV